MLQKDIQVGGRYVAKVSGKLTIVKVDRIRERFDHRDKSRTVFDVTNIKTGRHTTFNSAAKFRAVATVDAI